MRKGIPMKLKLIIILGVLLLACQVGAEETLVLKTQKDKDNYNTGVKIVRSLKQQGGEINLDVVIQGMKDELTGEGHILTEDNVSETMVASQNELRQNQKSDEERTVAALFVSTPDASQGYSPRTSVSSQVLVPIQPPVQFQTFADLQVAQAQANDEPVKIERSDLARRFSESWLKTHPSQ